MGKMSRNKGAKGEREVAEMLRLVFPNAKRRVSGEESQEDQGRDLKNTGDWVVQCNKAKRPNPIKKFNEAAGACNNHMQRPVAFTKVSSKDSSGPWLVTLRASDFIDLIKAADAKTTS